MELVGWQPVQFCREAFQVTGVACGRVAQGDMERLKENEKKVQYVINKQINTKQSNRKGKVVAQRYCVSKCHLQGGETKRT